jgi:exosortase
MTKIMDRSNGSRLPILLVAPVLIAACFALAFHSTLNSLLNVWATSEDYSHGFLIIPVSLYLIWRKRQELAMLRIYSSKSGLAIIVISLFLYLFSKLGGIATLASLAMVFTIWGIVVYLYGYEVTKRLAFPLFFLFFMIPVPSQIYASLTIPLQLLVTKISTIILAFTGMPVHAEGNLVLLPDNKLQVVNACSGLWSMTSILTLSALFGYLMLNSFWSKSLLFLSGIPISIFVNIIRIVLLAVLSHFFIMDIGGEPFHSLMGVTIFIFAFIFLFAFKGLLSWTEKTMPSGS